MGLARGPDGLAGPYCAAVRIAHLSDLHLLSLEGAVPYRLFNKRITGYLNLRFHRKSVHKAFAVKAAARAIQGLGIDQVVITGDVSNLALEKEFELVRTFLAEDLRLPADRVSLVPGNHDAYTGGAHRSRRFARAFAAHLQSDLPDLTPEGEIFPYVHLRGPAAIIGLSTALPRLPLVASGALGRGQLAALERILAHPEVRGRTPVILQHHPIHNSASSAKRLLEGLGDADEEAKLLAKVERGLLLHGHLHRRVRRRLATDRGHLDAVGATSASLLHESDARMAGFNVYEIDDDGSLRAIESHRMVQETGDFREVAIPRE
jgi:3',5'-cyclic AMP phosphodiesterase CpdA